MLTVLLMLAGVIILSLAVQPMWRRRARGKISARPFPEQWRRHLQEEWPLYTRLPQDLRDALHVRIQLFLAEKSFYGCQGIEVSEKMRVLIAAQACILIVGKTFAHFDAIQSILVYPSAFFAAHGYFVDEHVREDDAPLLAGEAWENGRVILAWDETLDAMVDSSDGVNVVIHEFAHVLDQENGVANGSPYLSDGQSQEQWTKVFSEAFSSLQSDVDENRTTLFDCYAATDPAEFFAVACEVFFEQGNRLRREAPSLYQQLQQYFRVDSATWQ